MRRILAFLRGQNTHLQWWAGVLGISLALFVELGGKASAESWVDLHFDGFAKLVNAGLEGIAIVAIYCWFPALIGVIIGRPPWIPQQGGPFVAKDV